MSGYLGITNGIGQGTDYGVYGLLVEQSDALRTQENTLSDQAATGLVSSVFSGLGAGAGTALDLRAEITSQQATISGISVADQKITLTQSVLSQIGSIASSFRDQTASLNGLDPSNVDVVAASARQSLVQLAGLLDTQNGNDYLFGGSETGAAPVPAADSILTSGFFTQISASVQALGTSGAAATAAATLATASSNSAGTSPFSAALSAPAATLDATLPTVDIGNGTRLTIGIAASANASAVSSGTSTTGSYIRDLMRSLATIGSLSSSQVTDTGFNDLVADTATSLDGAVAAIADEQGILGTTQDTIDNAGTLLTSVNTALTSQVSNVQDVDVAAVSTKLSETQANLQASYKLIANLGTLSLLSYL